MAQRGFNQVHVSTAMNTIVVLLSLPIILIPFWLHPMRKRLRGWVTASVLGGNVE
jgi:hypothetical protein